MSNRPLNRELLRDNTCFGCGHRNPHGLGIEIRRDPDDPSRLVGSFDPADHMVGFPGITHGGAIYTALDCMAAWTPIVLRREIRAVWLLRSASIKYVRPAHLGRPLRLVSRIVRDGGPRDPVVVLAEARDAEGDLLTEGTFKVVPLSPERLERVAGIDRIPANWAQLLGVPAE